ncbi:MAG: hypothetical protein CM1200mP30_16540 [Pseudomonadota bacterium]|nr:MAG: hypothetical protein CM1200mP30_16540 [Pseudomonadota bacterium]
MLFVKNGGKLLLPERQKNLLGFFKSFNGGFIIRKKCFMLTGKFKLIDVELKQHQQVHPSLMYDQFG